ncbi:MAG: hypothetical protein ACM3SY_06290 [Candidatus Omnitrophota bacterium]
MLNKEEILEKAKKVFSTSEGQEAFKESIKQALKESEKYKMCREINPEILRKPFTI